MAAASQGLDAANKALEESKARLANELAEAAKAPQVITGDQLRQMQAAMGQDLFSGLGVAVAAAPQAGGDDPEGEPGNSQGGGGGPAGAESGSGSTAVEKKATCNATKCVCEPACAEDEECVPKQGADPAGGQGGGEPEAGQSPTTVATPGSGPDSGLGGGGVGLAPEDTGVMLEEAGHGAQAVPVAPADGAGEAEMAADDPLAAELELLIPPELLGQGGGELERLRAVALARLREAGIEEIDGLMARALDGKWNPGQAEDALFFLALLRYNLLRTDDVAEAKAICDALSKLMDALDGISTGTGTIWRLGPPSFGEQVQDLSNYLWGTLGFIQRWTSGTGPSGVGDLNDVLYEPGYILGWVLSQRAASLPKEADSRFKRLTVNEQGEVYLEMDYDARREANEHLVREILSDWLRRKPILYLHSLVTGVEAEMLGRGSPDLTIAQAAEYERIYEYYRELTVELAMSLPIVRTVVDLAVLLDPNANA